MVSGSIESSYLRIRILYFQVSIMCNDDEVDNIEVTDTGHGWV